MRTVACADEAEQQLSRLAPSGLQLSADVRISRAGLRKEPSRYTTFPRLRLKFEVARQASSLSLCASVQEVPIADEAEQHLSRLSPFGCELSAVIRILGAGQPEAPGMEPAFNGYVGSLRRQDKQAAQVSVPLCKQCHGQMRLSNSFPGCLFLPASSLQTFAFWEQGSQRSPARTPKDTFEV